MEKIFGGSLCPKALQNPQFSESNYTNKVVPSQRILLWRHWCFLSETSHCSSFLSRYIFSLSSHMFRNVVSNSWNFILQWIQINDRALLITFFDSCCWWRADSCKHYSSPFRIDSYSHFAFRSYGFRWIILVRFAISCCWWRADSYSHFDSCCWWRSCAVENFFRLMLLMTSRFL